MVKMLNGNLLTVASEEKFEKEGGIYIPTAKKNYKKLEVVEGEDGAVEAGKSIYVNISIGTDIEIEGKKYVVVNKRDVILIL